MAKVHEYVVDIIKLQEGRFLWGWRLVVANHTVLHEFVSCKTVDC